MGELLQNLVSQLKGRRDVRQMLGKCENRALPRSDSLLRRKREWNAKLSSKAQRKEQVRELEQALADGKAVPPVAVSEATNTKPRTPEQQLFDMLLAPVYSTLVALPKENPVIFIPDKDLFQCPFGVIRDWTGTALHEMFSISCMPSFYVLERVVNNELDHMRHRSEVELRRQQSRMAGMSNLLNSDTKPRNLPTSKPIPSGAVNAKCISNPHLARSLSFDVLADNGMASAADENSWQTSPTIDLGCGDGFDVTGRQRHAEKAMGSHTLTTLVTHTSTNTDVVKSSVTVADFKQVSSPDKCTVIGNPFFPDW